MLTVKDLKDKFELKQYIAETVNEILTDPDFGLELTEKAKRRLRQARNYKGPLIPLEEIDLD